MLDLGRFQYGGRFQRRPILLAYGMGVDSTAIITHFVRHGIIPDKILFADTGGEKPETYAYLPIINAYLKRHGFPQVEVIRHVPKTVPYKNLYDQCVYYESLPSLAYGWKTCSLKWKVAPQEKYCNHWNLAKSTWARGHRIVKVIGYDAGPKDAKRGHTVAEDDKYELWFPLRELGWDRARCAKEILDAGLPLPIKSACWFCPASQPEEVFWIAHNYTHLFIMGLDMEQIADDGGKLKTVEGLWRTSTKKRPGAWRMFALEHGIALFDIRRRKWYVNPKFQVLPDVEYPQHAVGCGGF